MAGRPGGSSAAIGLQRQLLMPAPLCDACGGFLRGNLGGQIAWVAVEQGGVTIRRRLVQRSPDRGC